MRKIKNIVKIFLVLYICLMLVGCKEEEKKELKGKVVSELGYINIKILDMLNALNNLTFENYTIVSEKVELDDKSQTQQDSKSGSEVEQGEENSNKQNNKQEQESQDLINTSRMITDTILTKDKNKIDWQIIKPEIELLNESWSVIALDLYALNVNEESILEFSTNLNSVIITMKNEDKTATLLALANLYESIPKILKEIDADENLQRIRQTQSYVINAYSLAQDMSNPDISININKAMDNYLLVISDTDYTKDKTYKTNKIYVLLNELSNSLDLKDSDVFYIKYKNFMEAVNEL